MTIPRYFRRHRRIIGNVHDSAIRRRNFQLRARGELPHWMYRELLPSLALVTEHDAVTASGSVLRGWRVGAAAAAVERQVAATPPLCLPGEEQFPVLRVASIAIDAGEAAGRYVVLMLHANQERGAWSVDGEHLRVMQRASSVLTRELRAFHPQPLGDYFIDGEHYNEMLEFCACIVSGAWTRQGITRGPLCQLRQHDAALTARSHGRRTYTAMLDTEALVEASARAIVPQVWKPC